MKTSAQSRTVLAAAAVGVLALAGCNGSESSDSSGSTAAQSEPGSSASSATAADPADGTSAPSGSAGSTAGPDADLAKTSFPISLEQAVQTARKTGAGGTVTKIEFEFSEDAGAWAWKIDVQKGTDQHEVAIDARSGKVVSDDRDHESDNPRAVTPKKLTPQRALAKATDAVPGSVAEWALEYDDGVQRYTVEVRTSGNETTDVIVAVDSGKVTEED